MYKLLLILKYLRRKLVPMLAVLAVLLCTMMVIIVISVMGGFLNLLQDAARRLTGDVIVTNFSLTGFPHYETLQARLEALPEVDVATPMISTFGLINIGGHTAGVQIQGIRPDEFDRIVDYRSTILWDSGDKLAEVDDRFTTEDLEVPQLREAYERQRAQWTETDLAELGMTLRPPDAWQRAGRERPGMVVGVEINPWQRRDDQGQYKLRDALIQHEATLTVMPLTQAGATRLEPSYGSFLIVNEFKSGLYDVDANVVFVPFESLQRMLDMDPREVDRVTGYNEETGEPLTERTTRPGRATEVVLKAAPGVTLPAVAEAVSREVAAWSLEHEDVLPPAVLTWEERHATLLSAVRNETGLVTFLFALISLVAVVMVFATLYSIVIEKTRDVGVLRAIGASRLGVLGLFIGYGLAIGIVGSGLGAFAAWGVVTNLNGLQWFMATYLGVTAMLSVSLLGGGLLGAVAAVVIGFVQQRMRFWLVRLAPALALLLFVPAAVCLLVIPGFAANLNESIRFVMWDPQTYFFDRIPDRVNPATASLVIVGAVLSSVVGAVIPALIASSLEPVEALRYE